MTVTVNNKRARFYRGRLFFFGVFLAVALVSFACGLYVGQKRRTPHVSKQVRWSIGIYEGETPFELRPMHGVKNPVITFRDVKDIDAEFVADPFMATEGGKWYMFFEVLNKKTKKGEIAFAIRGNHFGEWVYEKVVITEPFHLSYPYVFKWNDDWYMVPESYQASSVRLYKAKRFPTDWVFVGTILSGDEYLDSSLFWYRGKWWLFTTVKRDETLLRLFYSERLDGEWREHALSPVVKNTPRRARSGGRIIFVDGRPIRFGQDDSMGYGYQDLAYEILEISERTYSERLVTKHPIVVASGEGWNNRGMHHIDAHAGPEGGWIACVDGKDEVCVIDTGRR